MTVSARRGSESLLMQGVMLIAAGTAACALGSLMARPAYQQTGYFIAALIIAGCLLVAVLSLRVRGRGVLSRPMAIAYIGAGLAMVCYAAFSGLQSSPQEIPVVGLLAGLLGLFWSARCMMFAFSFPPNSIQAVGLCALAATNSSFGIIVATRTELSRLGMVVLSGCYVIVLGIQLYLTAVMVHRELAREKVV